MFGYVTVNQDELKVRELKAYQAYYCGLCKALHDGHGLPGQVTLTYDMTFLTILLTGLYEDPVVSKTSRCPVHPVQKKEKRWNRWSGYCADMNVLLAYFNLLDDWQDDKKIRGLAGFKLLGRRIDLLKKQYPRQYHAVESYIEKLGACEQANSQNVEEAAYLTGKMLAEIFVYEEDEWAPDLRQMGFFLGKFIYLMDAYEDVEKDIKSGSYNPLKKIKDLDIACQQMLTMQMTECCRAFERLPIILEEELAILRNILYAGVWAKFHIAYNKRNKAGERT